jgi:hypothetical protein
MVNNMSVTDSALLRITLFENFENMISIINTLCEAIQSEGHLQSWVSRTDQEIENHLKVRDKAVMLYKTLWYEDGQDGRETLTCPGLVGASSDTLQVAHECNKRKDLFKKSVLALKALSKPQVESIMIDLHARDEEVALMMRRMGAARLNLKQAYRHIPSLDTWPTKVGFTWSKQGRTIQRTSVAEARRLLERRKDSTQVHIELERLSKISENEVLARVRRVCPHLRANIVSPAENNTIERKLIQAPLPILVPLKVGQSLPEFIPIPPNPVGSVRLKRSDVRIEEEPFLPLIRIHRYYESYR